MRYWFVFLLLVAIGAALLIAPAILQLLSVAHSVQS